MHCEVYIFFFFIPILNFNRLYVLISNLKKLIFIVLIFRYEPNSGPDVFYVEEAQETLLHIQKIGVPTLAEKWITANAKPEIAPFEANAATKVPASLTENLLNFIKSTDSQNTLSKSSIHSSGRRISQETISYSKQRSFEDSLMKSGSGTYFRIKKVSKK